MKTFEYLQQKINVPENWDEVTLKTYESFFRDKPENTRERLAVVAKICNVSPEELLEWPAEVLPMILDTCKFLWVEYIVPPSPSVKVDGVTYVIQVEEKLTLGQYIDATEAQKQENDILSNVLAIVCRPASEQYNPDISEERAAMFSKLSMAQVQPLLAFFLSCKNVLDQRTTAFSNLVTLVESLPPSIQILRSHGAGTKLWQIWQTVNYGILTALLRHRLRRLLRSCNITEIKTTQKGRRGASINN